MVTTYVATLRDGAAPVEPRQPIPSPRRVTTWIMRHPRALTDDQREQLERVLAACPQPQHVVLFGAGLGGPEVVLGAGDAVVQPLVLGQVVREQLAMLRRPPVATDVGDRAALGDRGEPGTGILRNPGFRPLLHRRDQGILRQILWPRRRHAPCM